MQEYNPLALSSLITLLSRQQLSSIANQEVVLERLRNKMITDYPFFIHAKRLLATQQSLATLTAE